jgi:hypothetical protein
LRDIVIRVALSNDAPPSAAVLKSLLAFSSLHRYGFHSQAAQLKESALSALAVAAKAGVSANDVIPHLAAGMLLCCFEVRMKTAVRSYRTNLNVQIQLPSETSSHWSYHISGVKNLLMIAGHGSMEWDSDMTVLTNWVFYHDALASFSLRHWQHRGSTKADLLEYLNIQAPQIDMDKFIKV